MFKYFVLASIVLLSSCKKDDVAPIDEAAVLQKHLNLPEQPYNYANPALPAHLLHASTMSIDNTPSFNPVTDNGATLGRVLFYEKKLSTNNTVSCATCHKQNLAFSDPNVKSIGFDGGETNRHSMGLINATYYANASFFWDERAATLEDQVLMPIQDTVEMGLTLGQMLGRIQAQPYYPVLYKRAFGSEEITVEKTAFALAQYVRSIVSYNTKYDEGRAMVQSQFVPFPNFTEEENRGKLLFMIGENSLRCIVCHGGESFTSPGIRNNGLDVTYADDGVGGITGNANEIALFKSPSLRSVLLRPPYMHDGRFATIEEVIDHYSTGIQAHPNLDMELTDFDTGLPKRFNLTEADKAALIAFMATLTDSTLITDPKFSDPFK